MAPTMTAAQIDQNKTIPFQILENLSKYFHIDTDERKSWNPDETATKVHLAYSFYTQNIISTQRLLPCPIEQFTRELFSIRSAVPQETMDYFIKHLEAMMLRRMKTQYYAAVVLTSDLKHILLMESIEGIWDFFWPENVTSSGPLSALTKALESNVGQIKGKTTCLLKPDDFIDNVVEYKCTRLYISHNLLIPYMPINTQCKWFAIADLPKNIFVKDSHKFAPVLPFMNILNRWIIEEKTAQMTRKTRSLWKRLKPESRLARAATFGGLAVGGALGCFALAPVALGAIGFSSAGVVGGSIAAGIQSSIGSVAGGSLFASLQSIGAAGFATSTVAGTTAAVGGTVAGISAATASTSNGSNATIEDDNVDEEYRRRRRYSL